MGYEYFFHKFTRWLLLNMLISTVSILQILILEIFSIFSSIIQALLIEHDLPYWPMRDNWHRLAKMATERHLHKQECKAAGRGLSILWIIKINFITNTHYFKMQFYITITNMLVLACLLFWRPSSPYWGHGAQRHDPAKCDCWQCGTLPPLTFHTQTWCIDIPLPLPHICPSSPPSSPPRTPVFGWLLCDYVQPETAKSHIFFVIPFATLTIGWCSLPRSPPHLAKL